MFKSLSLRQKMLIALTLPIVMLITSSLSQHINLQRIHTAAQNAVDRAWLSASGQAEGARDSEGAKRFSDEVNKAHQTATTMNIIILVLNILILLSFSLFIIRSTTGVKEDQSGKTDPTID